MTNPETPTDDALLEVTDITPVIKGGQHVGVPIRHIKVLHKPTGIYAVVASERSAHKNRRIATAMVEYGLAEMGWNPPLPQGEEG